MEPSRDAPFALVYMGAPAAEARQAHAALVEDVPGVGLLAVTSADRLHADWRAAQLARARGEHGRRAHVEKLLGALAPGAALATGLDGHPAALSWLGAVAGQRVASLGVEAFGQSGDLPSLYRHYRLDTDAWIDAAARVHLDALRAAAPDPGVRGVQS